MSPGISLHIIFCVGNPRRHVAREQLVTLFVLNDIRVVRAWRRGQTEDIRAMSRQNPTNTGNVPPLLALANNGHDLILGVGH
ncbi:hypothetical protein Tco_0577388, partial [Tanacetum coccineum]